MAKSNAAIQELRKAITSAADLGLDARGALHYIVGWIGGENERPEIKEALAKIIEATDKRTS